jgi:hypothetical protein
METLVSLAIMLARKGFAADIANEWTLVCMCSQM